MTLINALRPSGAAHTSPPAPGGGTPEPPKESTEDLFREAKRRERRRRGLLLGALLTVAGLVIGLVAAFGTTPPSRPPQGTGAATNPEGPDAVAAAHFIFRGNGLGTASFGQREGVVIAELDKVLGRPLAAKPTSYSGNCTVDAYLSWPTMAAYFFHGRFVGYNSASLLSGPLSGSNEPRVIPNAKTAAGMRIGDTLAQGQRIYERSLRISYAQGGSWFAKTSTGTLDGYLTAVPGHPTPPVPRIADISAGSVGCPAASP